MILVLGTKPPPEPYLDPPSGQASIESVRGRAQFSHLWRPLTPFAVYLIVFPAVWTVAWVYGLYPWAVSRLGDTTPAYALVNISCRLAIWVLPVFWYLRYVDHVDPVEYLQLSHHWKRGLTYGVILAGINFAGILVQTPPAKWHGPYITWNSILSTSILIGFFEEIPFRGFILQKLEERTSFWVAAIISSLLFAAIHIPGWIRFGALTTYNAVSVFIFGVVMAIVFRYSKSLWAPIIAHSLNDFVSGVLIHR
jgi:membrane protease YdiL (CAAX protease family)